MTALVIRTADGHELPPALSAEECAELFGVGVDHWYAINRTGKSPVESVQLGRCLRWPAIRVLEVLGIDLEAPRG
jgi:hypothetical protein